MILNGDNVYINFQDGNHWINYRNIYVSGSSFIDQELLNSQKMARFISTLNRQNEILSALNRFNGFFAFVYQTGDALYAVVDRVRSIPIFYSLNSGDFYLSDDPFWIRKKIQSDKIDEIAAAEFLLTGYVTGRDTLYQDIKQLQAGEVLVLKRCSGKFELEIIQYYKYVPGDDPTISEGEALKILDEVLVDIFKRLIKLASGRTIVVPLSGGYDSRLIVLMLKKLGYDNVIAFSYGKPGNKESEISRMIAQCLEIQWEFVPYSNDDWYKWYRSEEFKKYSHTSCGLSSVPHIQDWPAVWMLKRRGSIPNDSLFVPGHGADILSGRVTKVAANRSIDPIEAIFKQNYSLWRCPSDEYKNRFKSRIASTISKVGRPQDTVCLFEYWRVRERHAKFIINSLRVYEFWGYSSWIPFWDNEFMDFWSRIPVDMKLEQKIYKIFVDDLTKQITKGNIDMDGYKNSWKKMFRESVIENIKKTPFINFARNCYKYYGVCNAYENNPLAFYGAIDKNEFSKKYTGFENINSFIAADIIRHLCRNSAKSKDSLTVLEVNK